MEHRMDQRISLVTLGVRDLARARSFYEALGWRGHEVEETVFFQAGGLVVTLWDRGKLAADSGVGDRPDPGGFDGVVLAHNLPSDEDVDVLVEAARRAGASVTKEPADTFYGGYAACIADPDGHLWEIAHNPGFELAADGTIRLPEAWQPAQVPAEGDPSEAEQR